MFRPRCGSSSGTLSLYIRDEGLRQNRNMYFLIKVYFNIPMFLGCSNNEKNCLIRWYKIQVNFLGTWFFCSIIQNEIPDDVVWDRDMWPWSTFAWTKVSCKYLIKHVIFFKLITLCASLILQELCLLVKEDLDILNKHNDNVYFSRILLLYFYIVWSSISWEIC